MYPMRAITSLMFALAVCLVIGSARAATPEANGQQSVPTNAEIEDLQRQIRAMQEQLNRLRGAQGATAQQSLMQQHWQSMLDYMQGMQSMPWMMGGRGWMGHGMMGRGMMGPRNPGDWMMGCPMVGGAAGGWQLPPGTDPQQYRSQMLQNMQRMHDQMARIWSTTDPTERQRLAQEHWQDMYRNMQTMRGMGWMWGGAMPGAQAAKPLPEPASSGAKLVKQYCTQCHAAPSPRLHTAAEWQAVTSRMSMNMQNFNAANWRGVKVPSESEMTAILGYMQKFAR